MAASLKLLLAVLVVACLLCAFGRANPFQDPIEARIRTDWRQVFKICPTRHYRSCEHIDKSNWTDGKRTHRLDLIQQQGRWLTFKIETFDQQGNRKTRGGDSWYVVLRDVHQKLMYSTRVFDDGDGTYTVAAIIHQPGNYSVLARLWYSDCHSVQEPVSGDGKPLVDFYKTLKKKDHCHIGTRVRLKSILIEPGSPVIQTCDVCQAAAAAARQQQQLLPVPGHGERPPTVTRADYYVYRQDGQLKFVDCCKPRLVDPPQPKRLMVCGDSTMRQQWHFLLWTARTPCRWGTEPRWFEEMFEEKRCPPMQMSEVDPELDKVYRKCTGGPSWSTVPVGSAESGILQSPPAKTAFFMNMHRYQYNNTFAQGAAPPREFAVGYWSGCGTQTHTAESFSRDHMAVLGAGDLLVLNSGPHPSRTQTFSEFQDYIFMFAKLMRNNMLEKPGFRVVWRSSNIWKEHVFRNTTVPHHLLNLNGYISTGHFNTFLRGNFFDSFAEDTMLFAGIDVWDPYTITVLGDNRPWDMIHYDVQTIRTLNFDMLDQFTCKA